MTQIMTDQELLDALDTQHPGLSTVNAAIASNDLPAATAALVAYLRNDKTVDPTAGNTNPMDQPEKTSETGDKLMRHYAGVVDWFAVERPEETPERLYSTQVMTASNHDDLVQLAQAYANTGNHIYARACIDAIQAWIEAASPLPKAPPIGVRAPAWRTVHYSTPRAVNWCRCLFLLRDCPAIDDAAWLTVVKGILHHFRYAADNQVPGMPNMVIHLSEDLIGFGHQWPEFSEARGWIQRGIDQLQALLDDYFYPDGAYIELSYFVHHVFVNVARMGETGQIELPPTFAQKVAKIFDFPAYMVKPNGNYPSVNDNYSAQDPDALPSCRGGLVELGVEFTARDDLRHIATFGREGQPPPYTSRAFPYAGFYVMRSDWSGEARYLVFDGGKSAGGHNHVDKLSFELYAYGNTLVTDTGCGGPWASKWRSDYFVGTAGHNTIMVDGRGQIAGVPLFAIPSIKGRTPWHQIAAEPLPNTWESGTSFDYAASSYKDGYATYGSEQSRLRGYRYELLRIADESRMQPWTRTQRGPLEVAPQDRVFVDHERKIFFAKPDYWILSDRLMGQGQHSAESLFHFQATATAVVDGLSVSTVNGGAGLSILPITDANMHLDIVTGREEPLQGWVPAGWGEHRPAPVAICSLEAELPVAIDTVLYPYRRDEGPDLSIDRLNTVECGRTVPSWDASAIRLEINARSDYFFVCHQRRALRTYGPLTSDARVGFLSLWEDGSPRQLVLLEGSYATLSDPLIIAAEHSFDRLELISAEHSFDRLELNWTEGLLTVRCHPDIGADIWSESVDRVIVNDQPSAAVPTGRLKLFDDWLD